MSNGLSFEICIGDLAAYNNGLLIFKWVDLLDLSYEEIVEKKNELLVKGTQAVIETIYDGDSFMVYPHEEWHIQDYSNNLGIQISEYSDLEKLCEFAEKIKDVNYDLLSKVYEATGFEIDEVISDEINFENYHFIDAENEYELGETVFFELYGDPVDLIDEVRIFGSGSKGILTLIAKNFDFEKYGSELIDSGEYTEISDGYLVCYE